MSCLYFTPSIVIDPNLVFLIIIAIQLKFLIFLTLRSIKNELEKVIMEQLNGMKDLSKILDD